jgi:hypothetical protein
MDVDGDSGEGGFVGEDRLMVLMVRGFVDGCLLMVDG